MADMAGEEAQQFTELVRSKLAAGEFNNSLVDLRNLHKCSSAGDLAGAERGHSARWLRRGPLRPQRRRRRHARQPRGGAARRARLVQ